MLGRVWSEEGASQAAVLVNAGRAERAPAGAKGNLPSFEVTVASQREVLRRARDAAADLDRILEAARRTPSAGNQQAWGYVVCTDREHLAQLAKVGPHGY